MALRSGQQGGAKRRRAAGGRKRKGDRVLVNGRPPAAVVEEIDLALPLVGAHNRSDYIVAAFMRALKRPQTVQARLKLLYGGPSPQLLLPAQADQEPETGRGAPPPQGARVLIAGRAPVPTFDEVEAAWERDGAHNRSDWVVAAVTDALDDPDGIRDSLDELYARTDSQLRLPQRGDERNYTDREVLARRSA